MATATADAKTEELTCPSCGKTKDEIRATGEYFGPHVGRCKGPQATSGRIAGSSTSPVVKKPAVRRPDPPRGKRTSVKRHETKRVARGTNGHVREPMRRSGETSRPGREPMAISPAAFIAALEAERQKIDDAIAAVRALA